MRDVFVTMEGLKRSIFAGDNLVEYLVTVGQDELSSTCSVTVADVKGDIAGELINHTLLTGGIQKLKGSSAPAPSAAGGITAPGDAPAITGAGAPTTSPKNPKEWENAIIRFCLANKVTDKGQISYILATAKGETDMGQNMNEKSSGQWYDKGGATDLGRGLIQITGIASYETVKKKTGVDVVSNPNLANRPDVSLSALVIGMRDGWFANGRPIGDYIVGQKQDFIGARRIVGGINAPKYANYAMGYYAKIDSMIAEATGAAPPAKVETPPSAGAVTAQPATPPIKGSKISISIDGVNFEYFHQSTNYDVIKGVTVIGGQSVRYVMDRRKRSRTVTDTTLKAFAEKLTKDSKIKLDWQAPTDISYTAITQQGISDFAVLIRECQKSGYFVSDNNGTITVKALSQVKESGVTLAKSDMVSAVFRDEALDGSKVDNSSALLQDEPKAKIDPASGTMTPKLPDVDTVKDTSVTGKKAEKPTGKVAEGMEAVQVAQRSRKKRVKGLPATFVVYTSKALLNLKPLDVITTTGFNAVLSRKWIVDHVAHKGSDSTTEIKVYSPIEVIDLTPAPVAGASAATGETAVTNIPPGSGYIMPANGLILPSGYFGHPRDGGTRLHKGWDISGTGGDTIIAMDAGIVSHVTVGCRVGDTSCGGFYGNHVDIKHANGELSRYAHLQSVGVRVGQAVTRGQEIGKQGTTGSSTGNHLHFEIRTAGNIPIDPKKYLPSLKVGAEVKVGQK